MKLKDAVDSLANWTALSDPDFTVLIMLQKFLHLQAVAGLALSSITSSSMLQ
jgi:hypothetical protein